MRSRAILPLSALVAAGALSLAACGGSSSSGGSANAANDGGSAKPLSGASFTVGSKDFSEQIILGEITIDLLKKNGADVTDKTNIKGSTSTRQALESGDISMYWEYTGTGWITYLKNTKPIAEPQGQYDAVAKDDLAKNGISWLDPAPLNNTYAFAVKKETADKLNVHTLSDLATLAKSDPKSATFCIESEFSTRDDGFPGMTKAYGIDVPKDNVKMLDTGVIYTETAKGNTCNFGEVFATDGRIKSLGLVVLQDDKNFFPVYQPALTLKKETLDKYPALKDIFAPVAPKLTTEVMQQLNARADVDGDDPKTIAEDWLKQEGLL
ncbi:MAG: glycine betaine ABC transporter substrate-binding protein [Motilibacteraceae bacterium]